MDDLSFDLGFNKISETDIFFALKTSDQSQVWMTGLSIKVSWKLISFYFYSVNIQNMEFFEVDGNNASLQIIWDFKWAQDS